MYDKGYTPKPITCSLQQITMDKYILKMVKKIQKKDLAELIKVAKKSFEMHPRKPSWGFWGLRNLKYYRDTLTGRKLLKEQISERSPVRSIQLPQPYTESTGDNDAPDAHFDSSFLKSL